MRQSIFVEKVFNDLKAFGIEPREDYADKSVEMLEFVSDGMEIDVADELKDAAYVCYAVGYNTLVGIFKAPEEVPEYIATIPAYEDSYRGIDIVLNDIRFRSGYLGESPVQEDFNVGLIAIFLFEEYSSIPNILPPNEEMMFYLNLIKMARSLVERLNEQQTPAIDPDTG
jgi:hypothetical protein